MQMNQLSVKRILLDGHIANKDGTYEFIGDCGAVYFGTVYDNDGNLTAVDQYFYSDNFSRDDLDSSVTSNELLSVDNKDYWAKTYLLSKQEGDNEWLRFHAVVPPKVDPDYFQQKYIDD